MIQDLVLPENFISSEKLSKFSNIVFAENINKDFYTPSADLIVVDELEDELHKSITYKSSHLNLRSGSIVFSHTDFVDELFFLLNKEKKLTNITLISSQSDKVISNKLYNKKPSSITQWFAVNNSIMNDFVKNIPLGLGNSFSKKNVTSDDIPPLSRIFYQKNKISLYLNFNVNTNYKERSSLYENFRNKDWCHISTSNNREDYIKSLRSSAFILCPSGNGPDTHRMWESLYFGSIPIIKKHRCFEGYQDLPILYVDSFNEVNKDLLSKFMDNLDIEKINLEKLDVRYWKKKFTENIILTTKGEDYSLTFSSIELFIFSIKKRFDLMKIKLKKRSTSMFHKFKKLNNLSKKIIL
jgi:hypothetical protein